MIHIKHGCWLMAFSSAALLHCSSSSDSNGSANLQNRAGPQQNGNDRATNLVQADYHTKKTPPRAAGEFDLITLSTLPQAVTGDDVLIGLRGLDEGDGYTLTRNGQDVGV